MLDQAEIQAYLQNNERPSHSLVADIQQLLSGPVAQIDNLQAKMARLRAQMKDAQMRGTAIEESKNPYKKVLSAIRFIPKEVLRRIFVSCLSFDPPYPTVDEPGRPPILLTHVCRRWRNLAILTPELDPHPRHSPSCLPFMGDDDTRASEPRHNLAKLLRRPTLTMSLKLSTDQYLASDYHPLIFGATSVLMATVALYIHRCRDLSIVITFQQLACLDEHLSLEKVANIESLNIYIIHNTGMPEPRDDHFGSPLFADLPSLRHLSLGSLYEGDPIPCQSSGVWQNLTQLIMQDQFEAI